MLSTIVTANTHAMWHRHVCQVKLDQLVAGNLPMMPKLVWVSYNCHGGSLQKPSI